MYLVLEYINGVNMLEALMNKKLLSEDWVRYVMKEIFEAFQFLEANSILHRDLKLENILFMLNN